MRNSDSIEQRVLEAAKLTAWANCCDYAADEKGRPLSMTAIANLIGSTVQRVSEACEALRAEYCLRIVNRVLFPVDDPILERIQAERRRNAETNSDPSGNASPKHTRTEAEEVADALVYLERADPTWFSGYQQVDETFRQAAEDRKRWRKEGVERFRAAQPEQADEAEDVENEFRPGRKTDPPDGSENYSEPDGKEPGASLYGLNAFKQLASYEEGTPERLVDEAVTRSGLPELPGNRDRAVRAAAGRVTTVAPEQLTQVVPHFEADLAQIARRRENKPKNWGIIVTVMEDAIKAVQKRRTAPRTAATASSAAEKDAEPTEEQRRQWEATLADPNATGKEKELASICLRPETAERKPVAREGNEQARKAGQA